MIAKRIPPANERSGKLKDVAAAYGLTVEQYRDATMDALQNEWYCQTCGYECQSDHEWLTHTCARHRLVDPTPWQKGDDNPA